MSKLLACLQSKISDLMKIHEGGYAKAMRTLRGLEPQIETVAFLTAENPCGNPTSQQENRNRNEKLTRSLKDGFYSFRKIKGKYGTPENSFLINNISKEDALRIGFLFNQETIIFGKLLKDEDGMVFQMIRSFNCSGDDQVGEVVGEKKIFIGLNKDAEDYFSEIEGRKFQIPFFDDDYEEAEWEGGKIAKKLSEEDDAKLNHLIRESLNTEKTGKYRWIRRGMIKTLLAKYH